MEIQQYGGVVVDAAAISAGLRQASARGRGVAREEGGAKSMGVASLPPPSLYRAPRGAPTLGDGISKGGGGQVGGKGCLAPQGKGEAPPLGFPTLGAGGEAHGGAPAHYGLVPFPLQPMGPSGIGGPTRWTPGTLPVVPVQYR